VVIVVVSGMQNLKLYAPHALADLGLELGQVAEHVAVDRVLQV
jgi:hypothetical protein